MLLNCSGTFIGTADIPITNEWAFSGRIEVSYTCRAYNNQINTTYFGERTVTNLRLAIESRNYSVAFWTNNLFNVGFVANAINQPRAGYSFAFSVLENYLGETRRMGLTVSAEF